MASHVFASFLCYLCIYFFFLIQQDDNKDGVFTVQELITWVETNLLVKFVEEGRDADMDYIIKKKSTSEQLEQKEEDPKA